MNGAAWLRSVATIDRWVRGRGMVEQIALFYLALTVVASGFGLVRWLIDRSPGVSLPEVDGNASATMRFVSGVVIAPLVETWIGQSLILDDLSKTRWLGAHPRVLFALSVLFFGAQHFYSIGYFLYGCAGGVVFAYSFLVGGRGARGFSVTAAVHALWNFTVFCLKNIG